MINGEMQLNAPIRWAMVGGGRSSQIGYIHRSAALRDSSFQLVAGAFDINAEAGRQFGIRLGVAADRCYPDYKAMFEAEARLRAAEQFLAAGRRAEGETELEKALAFYRSVGATLFIERGEALLAKIA